MNEIEIPVHIQISESSTIASRQSGTLDSMLSAMNVHMLLGASRKFASALGNAQIASGIRVGSKIGTALMQIQRGNYAGAIGLAIDLGATAIKSVVDYVQKKEEDSKASNEALYNFIESGDYFIYGKSKSVDKWGKITYMER